MTGNILGERLRKLRMQEGVTQKVFADALNVSSSAVSKWENGQNVPDMQMLLEIAGYYGISIEELLEGELKKAEGVSEKQEDKREGSDEKKEPASKGNRNKWLGVGIALGCIITAVFTTVGIILWQTMKGNDSDFSYEIVAGRYAEDENWGEIYEVSVFYSGELLKECEDEVINDIMTQWEKGSLCHGEIEMITLICNNDREQAENFEKVYQTVIIFLAPYNMEYQN